MARWIGIRAERAGALGALAALALLAGVAASPARAPEATSPARGPAVNLAGDLPAAAEAGATLAIPLTVTNAGPGDVGDLGFELLSFRADIALFGGLASDPEARLGRVQYPFHSRTLLFGRLAAGQTAAIVLRLIAPP